MTSFHAGLQILTLNPYRTKILSFYQHQQEEQRGFSVSSSSFCVFYTLGKESTTERIASAVRVDNLLLWNQTRGNLSKLTILTNETHQTYVFWFCFSSSFFS